MRKIILTLFFSTDVSFSLSLSFLFFTLIILNILYKKDTIAINISSHRD